MLHYLLLFFYSYPSIQINSYLSVDIYTVVFLLLEISDVFLFYVNYMKIVVSVLLDLCNVNPFADVAKQLIIMKMCLFLHLNHMIAP